MNGDWRVFAKYKWLAPTLWMVAGGLGFRVALPWNVDDVRAEVRTERVERKYADSLQMVEVRRVATSLETHLAWADTTQRTNAAKQESAAEDIRAQSRFECMKAKRNHDRYAWDMLISSRVKCNDLLGNTLP